MERFELKGSHQCKRKRFSELIVETLESLLLPKAIAVVHVEGHQKLTSYEGRGNSLGDAEAKATALTEEVIKMLPLIPQLEEPKQVPVFTTKDRRQLEQIGAKQTEKGEWMLPDGRQMSNKQISQELLAILHQGRHWGTQALCDTFLQKYGCIGIYTVAQQICERCLICKKNN